MKTTLDLPEDLLIEAKTLAARRRTTLKALVENALRREVRPGIDSDNPDPDRFEIGPLGLLVLKRRPGATPITSDDIRRLEQAADREELDHALRLRGS